MISEGSCDTEDWSNGAEIQLCFTGINYILKYIKIENCYCNLQYYFTKLQFVFLYFWSNRFSLDEHKKKHYKSYWS